jgi:hypothetical protein
MGVPLERAMKPENMWTPKAKAPDPDDLTSNLPAGSTGSRRTNVDYTEMAHHQEIPDSADTGDISRPQGEFWHQNERPGAESIQDVDLGEPAKPPRDPNRDGDRGHVS